MKEVNIVPQSNNKHVLWALELDWRRDGFTKEANLHLRCKEWVEFY